MAGVGHVHIHEIRVLDSARLAEPVSLSLVRIISRVKRAMALRIVLKPHSSSLVQVSVWLKVSLGEIH